MKKSWLKNTLWIGIGTLGLNISAKVSIPFWPLHLTLQSFTVILIGFIYGSKLGALTVLFYLLEGALGFPVFMGTPQYGIGIPYMLGPSGGFLIGFVIAAYVSGLLAKKGYGRTRWSAFYIYLLGEMILHIPGMLWFIHLLGKTLALKNFIFLMPGLFLKTLIGSFTIRHMTRKS